MQRYEIIDYICFLEYLKNFHMNTVCKIITVALLGIAAASCSNANKMAQKADGLQIQCDPAVLEVIGGKIKAKVTVSYPESYFNPKAILEVVPVIVYDGGESALKPFCYQGEKVKDNFKVIPSTGATVSETAVFDFVPGMEKCYLELRGTVVFGKKRMNMPARKVADGARTTCMLVNTDGVVSLKDDGYQEIIKQTAEGQILYNINSSEVRGSQLSSKSIKAFQEALTEIQKDGRKTLTGTEIVAYASPDGGQKLNDKLSDQRGSTAEKAWNKVTKGYDAAAPEVKSIGQDWEGFKELVAKSNIEDKDLILRVLSMYSDPAVRESEIKNMAEIYKSLKGDVLPELRRARFIANVEYKNFSDEELMDMVQSNIDVLDETALLHAAGLAKDMGQKEQLYRKAIDNFDSDVARFNLAASYLAAGEDAKAEAAFKAVKNMDADMVNALGVLALRKGDLKTAEKNFRAAGTPDAMANMGAVDILGGNYAKAAQEMAASGARCKDKALAYILAGQYDEAEKALKCDDPESAYLRAIIAARRGDEKAVKENLAKAGKDPDLAKKAARDIEFVNYR